MHKNTHQFGAFRAWSEHRLLAFKVANTADQHAHEDFEAKENSAATKIAGPKDAAAVFMRERDSLIQRVHNANRSGLLTGWVPIISAWSRKRATDKALTKEAERLVTESNPQLALKGRFLSFLSLGWYRDAMFLAHMHQTKKELTQNLLKGLASSAEMSENRRTLFGKMKTLFGRGSVRLDTAGRGPDEIRALVEGRTTTLNLLDLSPKERERMAVSLQGVDRKADRKIQKYSVSVPQKYHLLMERELELRTFLDASGVLPIGDVSDRLINENRESSNSLIDRIRRDPTIGENIRETLIFRARELQGSGAIGKFFRGAPNNYATIVRSLPKTLNVLPINGRLKYLCDGKDVDVLYRSVNIHLPNDKVRRMKVKRREGEFVFLEEAAGPQKERARMTVNTEHRRVTRKGTQGEFLEPSYLNDASLLFV